MEGGVKTRPIRFGGRGEYELGVENGTARKGIGFSVKNN